MIERNNPRLAINGGKAVTNNKIAIHKPHLDDDDKQSIIKAFNSTFISGDGPDCRKFEKMLTEYLGVKYAFFFNSATSALDIAFRVKEFPQGSEVIVPDFTYTSSALGPLYNNLRIRLCDVYPDNGNIDVSKVEELINKKTVAIVPVDYAGNPADMDEICHIAKKHNLYIVHDTAQSIGAVYKGRRTGSIADVSTFSFHGTKNITTGEGGAIITNYDEIAEKIKVMRDKGTDKHSFLTDNVDRGYYQYVSIGNSYVQSNILGALGISQLQKIEKISSKRKKIAEYYLENLYDIPEIDFIRITNDSVPNWHIFGILVPRKHRYWIMDALRAEGVFSNVHYTPLHRNSFYQDYGTDDDFPGAMQFFGRLLRLPIYPDLTQEEMGIVVEAVRKVFS